MEILKFKNEAFVKENDHLSRECITVCTQISSNANVKLQLEFSFKGTNKRLPYLTPLSGMKYQWAPQCSYCLEQILENNSHQINQFNMFTSQNYAISKS